MINVVIIDDEKNIRETIQEMLKAHCPQARISGQAGSVAEGVELLRSVQVDLILLDIKLRDGTGFELLSQLENQTAEVVFITAFNEYALKAIKFSAFDYILKPFEAEDLVVVMQKYLKSKKHNHFEKRFHTLLEHMNDGNNHKKMVLNTLNKVHIIEVQDIVRCESHRGYTEFHMVDSASILVSKTLNYYHLLLGDDYFFKTHKSHLINLNHLKRMDKGSDPHAVMTDGSNVPVASRRREELLKRIKQYIAE